MPDQTLPASTFVTQEMVDAYFKGTDALGALLDGAYNPSMTDLGQDLTGVTLAFARIGKVLFPAGSEPHEQAKRIEERVQNAVVARRKEIPQP